MNYERTRAVADVVCELTRAQSMFPAFNSAHEGHSIIEEEFDELWDEVKKSPKKRDMQAMREEAIQLAAMSLRFLIEVCPAAICKPVNIIVNGRSIAMLPKAVTFDDVRSLAGYDEADSITFRSDAGSGALHPKEVIYLAQDMVFYVAFTDAA